MPHSRYLMTDEGQPLEHPAAFPPFRFCWRKNPARPPA